MHETQAAPTPPATENNQAHGTHPEPLPNRCAWHTAAAVIRSPRFSTQPLYADHVADGRPFEQEGYARAPSRYTLTRRSRSALPITDTELKDMAAAAIMGDSRMPKNGYSTPAAMGTPRLL